MPGTANYFYIKKALLYRNDQNTVINWTSMIPTPISQHNTITLFRPDPFYHTTSTQSNMPPLSPISTPPSWSCKPVHHPTLYHHNNYSTQHVRFFPAYPITQATTPTLFLQPYNQTQHLYTTHLHSSASRNPVSPHKSPKSTPPFRPGVRSSPSHPSATGVFFYSPLIL